MSQLEIDKLRNQLSETTDPDKINEIEAEILKLEKGEVEEKTTDDLLSEAHNDSGEGNK